LRIPISPNTKSQRPWPSAISGWVSIMGLLGSNRRPCPGASNSVPSSATLTACGVRKSRIASADSRGLR
jgi:hypothetical protein